MPDVLTGGCQCGAVRFRVESVGRGSICHCRMCQKAFGAFYAPLVSTRGLEWTRGAPAHFQSSNKVRRGFCSACGTPLSYEVLEGTFAQHVEISIGAFDEPSAVAPSIQVNPRDKLPFTDQLPQLPTRDDADVPGHEAFYAEIISFQHPDHDTTNWPPRRK